jgi:hypothetical protein
VVSKISFISGWFCVQRGASNSKFLNYINKHLLPVFDKLPEDKKLDLLKNLAESSPYTSAQDARNLLPSILQLLKVFCSAFVIEG